MERLKGTVVWFSDPLGYGFIKPDGEGRKDIFFYYSYLQMDGFKTVKADSRVSFEIGENHRGPMAVKVVLESSPSNEDDLESEEE